MLRSVIALLILLGLSPGISQAAELYEYHRPIQSYGSGGVYLPWVQRTDAVRWNPALLASTEQIAWKFVDVGLGANGLDMMDTYTSIQDSGCSGVDCYDQLYGKPLYVGYYGESSVVMPFWGLTIFTSGLLEGTLHNPAFPSFNLTFTRDYGFLTGVGFGLGPGLSGGVTLKRINRWGGNQDVGLSTMTGGDPDAILDGFNQRGTAYGFDMSLMYSTPESSPLKSTAVFHWQDMGSTAFIADSSDGPAPGRIQDNMSFGFGTELDLPGMEVRTGIELRHINRYEEQLGKKVHLGAEFSLPMIDLRGGLNQGYPTFGAGIDLLFFRLDLATYTSEVGVYPGQTPSQRIQVGLSFELSVDADFSLTNADGKARRLKQRR